MTTAEERMGDLPFSPYQMLFQAEKMFKTGQYASVLRITSALMLKFQPSAPLLLLAAASAGRLSHLSISRQILEIAKQSNCFLDKDFKIEFYEIILVTEFNARTDEYYSIFVELLKLTRNSMSENMLTVQFYYYLSKMNVSAAEQAAEGDLGVFSENARLCIQLLRRQEIEFDSVSPKNELCLALLEEHFSQPTENLVLSKEMQLTRKPFLLGDGQLMTLIEETEVLNGADWRVACNYLFDESGEHLGDVSACSRIFEQMRKLGFYDGEDIPTTILKLVSLWSKNNIVCGKLTAALHGVFHNMSIVWRSDATISKVLSIASLVSIQGSFQYTLQELREIQDCSSLTELLSKHPNFFDIFPSNIEYLIEFSSFLDQESRFELLYNVYLAVNQEDAAKYTREHISLLLFAEGRKLGYDAGILIAFFVGKYAPFVYDSENQIDGFKRLTTRQIHCILSVIDCKNEILMDRIFKMLKTRTDSHGTLLKATLLLIKSGLNEDFKEAFEMCKASNETEICTEIDVKAAKLLFTKYGKRIREEVDELLAGQYSNATVAPKQLLVTSLCYLLEFELDQFKAETISQYVLTAYEGLKVTFDGTEGLYLATLLSEVACKLRSDDIFHFSKDYPQLAIYRAYFHMQEQELGMAAEEAAAVLHAGSCSELLKFIVKSIYDAYFMRRRAASDYSPTFADTMKELMLATYQENDEEPWLVYPNAVLKKVRGDCECNVRGTGEEFEFAQRCIDALHGKIMVNDIHELAGMIQ